KSPATFDRQKLEYINNRYIKQLSTEEMVDLCKSHLEEAGITEGKTEEWTTNLVNLFHDRMSYGAEIVDLYREFFEHEFVIEGEELAFIQQDGVRETISCFKEEIEDLTDFIAENIQGAIKNAG